MPSQVHRNFLITVMKHLAQFLADSQRILLMGDLNVDVSVVANARFLDAELALLGLVRVPMGSTHITAHSATKIDILAVTKTLSATCLSLSLVLFGSGHPIVSATHDMSLHQAPQPSTMKLTHNWRHYNPEGFSELLRTMDWTPFADANSRAPDLASVFVANLTVVLDTLAPMKMR